jgi:2-polyprenyl-3-methyl-5-hydroxy-6-metoxy-1,4-benzoquinol methylase
MTLDEQKLNGFMGQVLGDLGATMSSILVVIGDRLGLWKALAAEGSLTPEALARRTELSERYVREWCNTQAAAGYLTYDPSTGVYTLPPEHAAVLAEELSPFFCSGSFEVAAAAWAAVDKATQNFRTGEGMAWGAHHPCLFQGCERSFRASYIGSLISAWIPSLDGVQAKLERGAKVADIGCGVGASTILMAQAFPSSRFYGFDSHAGSIELARRRAQAAGLTDRVQFEVAKSTDYPGTDYDLIANFDSLHDMEDPTEAARYARRTLADDGTWMIVEPLAQDACEHNHNPVGRMYYASSTMLCVPHSLAFGGPALGAQAGERRLRDVIGSGGFTRIRRASETPLNMVLEARP